MQYIFLQFYFILIYYKNLKSFYFCNKPNIISLKSLVLFLYKLILKSLLSESLSIILAYLKITA